MKKPIIIAHRGACGYLPEHTLESATMAYMMGADFIEQDLVLTKDQELVVLHDIHLDTVTDVAQQFPEKARSDGRFYALDFTLAEIKSLRVHERRDLEGNQVFPDRYQGNAEFKVATFSEQIELIRNLNRQFGKNIGLYPEIKSPAWHQAQGYDISAATVDMLRLHSLDDKDRPIFVQCFDYKENLRLRNELELDAKLIQLIGENAWQESDTDYDFLQTREGLEELSKLVSGIGPWIPHVINSDQDFDLSETAHNYGLEVHPYTLRKDAPISDSIETDLDLLLKKHKVDGVFTDFSDSVVGYINSKQLSFI